jgi:hypothetical protein
MRCYHALGVGVLAVLLSGVARAQDCQTAKVIGSVKMIPMERHLRELVPISVNGVEKKFILDTGGYLTQLSFTSATDMKLFQYVGPELSDMYGHRRGREVVAEDFQIGNLRASKVGISVQPDQKFADKSKADGLLAPDFMYAYDVDMDFGSDTLTFLSQDHCPGAVVVGDAVVTEVPFKIVDGHIGISVLVDGKPLQAIMDTGSTSTMIDWGIASQQFQVPPAPPPKYVDSERYGWKAAVLPPTSYKFSNLSFGGVSINSPTLALGALNQKRPVVLGMDMMRHLQIYMAFKERKLYISAAQMAASNDLPGP